MAAVAIARANRNHRLGRGLDFEIPIRFDGEDRAGLQRRAGRQRQRHLASGGGPRAPPPPAALLRVKRQRIALV